MNYRQKVGKFGEDLAVNYLRRHGYEIIERNTKISCQEIDIVAKIKEKLALIEVKTCTAGSDHEAYEEMGQRKLNNLKKGLSIYIDRENLDPDNVQLDLITIDFHNKNKMAKIKHYRDIY